MTRPRGDPLVETFAPVDAYQLMVQQVSRCVRGDGEPVVTLAVALRVAATMVATTAAARAAAT
ncbi:MAG: hypothetical protein H7231_09955 [Rhodoferax sp.]|nr:hypothetical protein [Actinomycetota bacterium]